MGVRIFNHELEEKKAREEAGGVKVTVGKGG